MYLLSILIYVGVILSADLTTAATVSVTSSENGDANHQRQAAMELRARHRAQRVATLGGQAAGG